MAARVMPAPANPCCAALQLRCSKLEEKRNALRQGCHILKDQLSRLEVDNLSLKKAYDEERARADHDRELKEKETAFRISVESKVAELESQLSSLQQACSPQSQNLDEDLMILQGKVSEREVEIDKFKQLLEEETKKTNDERENAKMEKQKALELKEALEAQKNRAKETCNGNNAELKNVDDLESTKATLLKYKELADQNERQFTEERCYANNLLKQLEEETVKVESLRKELLALKSFRESAEAGFAVQLSEKEAELNHLRDLLEVEKSRADVEQKKAATLQETLELEKNKSLQTSNLAQAEAKKAKESFLKIDRLKNEVSKLTLEHSKSEELNKKYEAEKQNVLRERQRADAEKVKAVELKKLAEENEERVMEEKFNSEQLLQQVEVERQKVETLQKQVQELLSYGKSAASAHSDNSDFKEAYSKLETENRRLIRKKKRMERVKDQELKRLSEENEKKVMEERSNSKQLAHQMDAEREKIKMLQKQVQELSLASKSTASGYSDLLKIKEAYSKLEDQNRMLIREKKQIEAEMGKVDDLRKLSEANEKRYFEEKCRADRSSHDFEMGKQKIKELEEELRSIKPSRKLVGSSTLPVVPDVSISTPILLHEQLKLEKKRLKHAKQVMKFEKNRNSVLQCELGKLKQDLVRTVQHLEMLEKTFCGGAQAVDRSTKLSDLSELQRLCLNKMLLGSNLFGALEDELVMPGSSARCASGSTIPVPEYSQPDNGTESPSGITTKLHPLVGGGPREISPISAMDSSAVSFPDKQLLGSQEQVAGSLATSTIPVDGKTNPLATISKHSDQAGKRKYSAHVVTLVDNSSRTPLENVCAPRQKRGKLLHGFESLNYVQIENRRLHEESEKMSNMHRNFNRLMPGQMEDAGCLLPDMVAAQYDESRKKRKTSHKPEEALDHSLYLANQIKGGKLSAPALLPAIKERGSVQPCVDHISDLDTLLLFEEQIQGNVMKLLELDNEADEELFRIAIENPLSPTLPILNCEISGLVDIDPSGCGVGESSHRNLLTGKDSMVWGALEAERNGKPKSYDPGSCSIDLGINNHIVLEGNKENDIGFGFEKVGNGTKIASAPIPISECAKQTDDSYQLGMNVETIPLFCILITNMEDINRISMMLFATRKCLTHRFMHSQTNEILMESLTILASEQQLTSREKVCVFFSLTMHHLLQMSANESVGYFNQGFLSSFPLYLCSVLSDVKNKSILAESFCFSELFCLFEDFVCQRRIIFCGNKDTEANNFTSRFDILLEGKKVVLYEKKASTHEVFAGSVIFASICLAVGQVSILLDVSFKVLQMWPADAQLILYILHGFAFVCGEKYFLTSNCSIQMEVVKSMVNVLENPHEVHGATLSQSDSKTYPRFPACARCPFAESLRPLDILSMLVKELRKHASVPVDGVGSSSSLSIPDYAPSKDICGYIDIMSSVELISVIMGWSWTAEKVLPELRMLLPSSIQGIFSTSLVLLLGRIGRFGVKSCGYEDAGVKSLKQYLSSLLHRIPLLEHNHEVAAALFSALDGISQQSEKGPLSKLDCGMGLSPASAFIRKCSSSLSSEQKSLNSALKYFPTSK